MKYDKDGYVTVEKDRDEPILRSCWVCNPAHDYLLKRNDRVFQCFVCDKPFIFGVDITSFYEGVSKDEGNKLFVKFMMDKGVNPGDSTIGIIFLNDEGELL